MTHWLVNKKSFSDRFSKVQLDEVQKIPSDQSWRLQLAKWLTHSSHPLTARVIVNRVWHHMFGTGIVATVDNFASTGEKPSHPKLLDNLAVQFIQNGWSIKKLVREIALSRTYRQSSEYREAAFHRDPENRLLWRFSKRRFARAGSQAVSIQLCRPRSKTVASNLTVYPLLIHQMQIQDAERYVNFAEKASPTNHESEFMFSRSNS